MMEKVIQFLKSNVIGKVLFTDDIVYRLDNGNLEGIYNDQMVFPNLVRTENGLKFSMTTVTHELIYNLDENGVRSTLVKDFTGTSVFCYEMAMRKSTNKLTGYMHCVSTTVQGQTMEAIVCGIYDVALDAQGLSWKENQLLYRDNPVGEDIYKPVAFDSKARIYLDKGKVIFEYLPTIWDVNPNTLEKRLSKDDYPTYISKER